MYRTNEKEQAIRNVQEYLLVISQKDISLPHLAVDGVYTEETRFAVEEFQKSRALNVTGTVDKPTFDLLYIEAKEIIDTENNRNQTVEREKFPLVIGNSGTDVSILNSNLRYLSTFYKDITELPYGSFFSSSTRKAVIFMQKVFRYVQTGEVDYNLYVRLQEEVSARNNFKK